MEEIRKTLEELEALYSLEPTIRDVYVEGPSDKAIISWFLCMSGSTSANVYEIEVVDIPPNVLNQLALENNNRGRVIALAMIMDMRLGNATNSVTCICDTDLDEVLVTCPSTSSLLLTDYTSLDMYTISEDAIAKLLLLAFNRRSPSGSDVLAAITEPARELFLLRLVNRALALALTPVAWHRCCTIRSGAILFDHHEYTRRYLNASGKISAFTVVSAYIERVRGSLNSDIRKSANSHDLLEILALYLHKVLRINDNITEFSLRRLLFVSASFSDLQKETMFSTLTNRLANY